MNDYKHLSVTAPSQKVKGLAWLHSYLYPEETLAKILPIHHAGPASGPVTEAMAAMLPAFCRPCPTKPQHGFVESRICKTTAALKALCAETVAAEEAAWMMITPAYKQVLLNAIWTPTSLTIGPGHDGATSGKGALVIPLVGKTDLGQRALKGAGITSEDDPYVEAIWPATGPLIVTQLRAGPPIKGISPDFIPCSVFVNKIISPAGEDLLGWQQKIKTLPSGAAVWHPGGSIADHYSVHCRLSGIPILISRPPQLGELLIPPPEGVIPPDPEAMLRGVIVGEALSLNDTIAKFALTALLVGLHNAAIMQGPQAFWLGAAAALTLRLGSVALRGEERHCPPIQGLDTSHRVLGAPAADSQRHKQWQRHWKKSLSYHRAAVSRLELVFRYANWASEGGATGACGYGGLKWAACAHALMPLFDAIGTLARERSVEAAAQLGVVLNIAVNQVHNGGWWLNKFNLSSTILNDVQNGKLYALLLGVPAFWDMDQLRQQQSQSAVDKAIKKMAAWPSCAVRAPRAKKVILRATNTKSVLEVHTRMGIAQRTLPKTCCIGQHNYLVPIPGGYRIEERDFNLPARILHEDVSLPPVVQTK